MGSQLEKMWPGTLYGKGELNYSSLRWSSWSCWLLCFALQGARNYGLLATSLGAKQLFWNHKSWRQFIVRDWVVFKRPVTTHTQVTAKWYFCWQLSCTCKQNFVTKSRNIKKMCKLWIIFLFVLFNTVLGFILERLAFTTGIYRARPAKAQPSTSWVVTQCNLWSFGAKDCKIC